MNLTDEILQKAERRLRVYKLYDGKGLSIEVPPTGNLRWRFKFRFQNKEKRLSVGVYPTVSIAEARKKRDELKKQLRDGVDPAIARKVKKSRKPYELSLEALDEIKAERKSVLARIQGLEYYVAELRVMVRDLREELLPPLN